MDQESPFSPSAEAEDTQPKPSAKKIWTVQRQRMESSEQKDEEKKEKTVIDEIINAVKLGDMAEAERIWEEQQYFFSLPEIIKLEQFLHENFMAAQAYMSEEDYEEEDSTFNHLSALKKKVQQRNNELTNRGNSTEEGKESAVNRVLKFVEQMDFDMTREMVSTFHFSLKELQFILKRANEIFETEWESGYANNSSMDYDYKMNFYNSFAELITFIEERIEQKKGK